MRQVIRLKKENFQDGGLYHFYNHSIGNELLFRKGKDYLLFLHKFKQQATKYDSQVIAYCLMPNHFHFLIQQKGNKPIYKIFNGVLSYYVQKYNQKYNRKGSLFQGKIQHKIVNDENYLIKLCKYIHYNPVEAGLVSDITNWKYSNLLEWIGIREGDLYPESFVNKIYPNPQDYLNSIKQYKYLISNDDGFKKVLLDN